MASMCDHCRLISIGFHERSEFDDQLKNHQVLRLEVLTGVNVSIRFFWVVTPYFLVGGYQRFGGNSRLHLQHIQVHKALQARRPQSTSSTLRESRNSNAYKVLVEKPERE
jgi:hypothetical protein